MTFPGRTPLAPPSASTVVAVDNRAEVRDFLISRRNRLTPADAGLHGGANRRVPGLRRAEVALLADVSVEYYSRVERGNLAGVSDSVLDAIVRALHLDDAERRYLYDLARAANTRTVPRTRTRATRPSVRASLQAAVDAITAGPAFVRNGRMDLLAANLLGRAFYADLYARGDRVPNMARYTFLEDTAQTFHQAWEKTADGTVAVLRAEAGRDPHDKDLHDLIGELSTRSEAFRVRWGAHNVRRHGSGVKYFRHPVVGDLTVGYEAFEVIQDPGLTLMIYTAEPGSASDEALRLLGSWAASRPWARDPQPDAIRQAP